MTFTSVPLGLRRLWPRRVRTRLAVTYTVLLLLAGTALLAVTYALVATVLLPTPTATGQPISSVTHKPISPQTLELLRLCKPLPASQPLLSECKRAIAVLEPTGSEQHASELAALRGASVIGLGVLTIVSVGLGWLVSGRAVRPVRSITEAARRASQLQLGERVALTGPDDEFKQLADTFDVMLERLDAAFTSQKRFVANAAHELRTPLTAMRTAIEVTLSKATRTPDQLEAMATQINRSVQRAEATVEALLTLSTSELGLAAREAVDLATVTEDALDATHAAIDQRQISVQAALEPALAAGDRVLLERMIGNLVENAVRHNDPGGWIGIRTTVESDSAVFEIANTGPAVAAEQIPTLFEPFARANQRLHDDGSVGLGLSIAEAIARAHDSTLTARPRPGGGLEVSVTLRAATSD